MLTKSLLLVAALALCGCVPHAPQIRFRIVLEKRRDGLIRLKEDPSMPIEYEHTTTVRESKGIIHVPHGFIDTSTPVFYRVERVEDKDGNVLAVGDEPAKGEWGLQSMPGYGGAGPDADPSKPLEVRHYFRFGVTP